MNKPASDALEILRVVGFLTAGIVVLGVAGGLMMAFSELAVEQPIYGLVLAAVIAGGVFILRRRQADVIIDITDASLAKADDATSTSARQDLSVR